MKPLLAIMLLLTVVMGTAQQLFFKLSGRRPSRRLLFNVLGILMYLGFAAIWLWVLKELPLGIALPLTSLTYVTVALTGKFFFQERLGARRWCGILLIVAGLLAVWRGGGDFL